MSEKKRITDEEQGIIFKSLLRTFEKIIENDPPVSKVKQELLDLAQSSTTAALTARQAEAVYDRCMNYINSTYGSTARLSH